MRSKQMKANYARIAESIALIMEDNRSSGRLCVELGKYVRSIIEETDLTHPDTVRRLLPVAGSILEETAVIQNEFQDREGLLIN